MLLVVDANVLVGELLRRRGRELIAHEALTLYISERARDETDYEFGRRFQIVVWREKITEETAQEMWDESSELLTGAVRVIPEEAYRHRMDEAYERIPRDKDDAPNVALALALESSFGVPFGSQSGRCDGIWTNDGDYMGCGVATWTTDTLIPNLARNNP